MALIPTPHPAKAVERTPPPLVEGPAAPLTINKTPLPYSDPFSPKNDWFAGKEKGLEGKDDLDWDDYFSDSFSEGWEGD